MKMYSPLNMFLKNIYVNLHLIIQITGVVCMFIFVFNPEIEEATAECRVSVCTRLV